MDKLTLQIDSDGDKHWRNDQGQLHRENGPAVIYTNGKMFWLINDKSHRIDGPVIAYTNEYKPWYLNGELVREFKYDQV